jgi:hypothetical protein
LAKADSSSNSSTAGSTNLYFRRKDPACVVAEQIAIAVMRAAGDHVVLLRDPGDSDESWVVIRRPHGVVYIPKVEEYERQLEAASDATDAGDDSVEFPESAWGCIFCGDKDITEERTWGAEDGQDGLCYGVCEYHEHEDSPEHMTRVLDLLAAEAAVEVDEAKDAAEEYFARVNARCEREKATASGEVDSGAAR